MATLHTSIQTIHSAHKLNTTPTTIYVHNIIQLLFRFVQKKLRSFGVFALTMNTSYRINRFTIYIRNLLILYTYYKIARRNLGAKIKCTTLQNFHVWFYTPNSLISSHSLHVLSAQSFLKHASQLTSSVALLY